jgi:hypothetical protein
MSDKIKIYFKLQFWTYKNPFSLIQTEFFKKYFSSNCKMEFLTGFKNHKNG